jgi:S-adenosylmethionine:tRNA ribosyltransferase-isomerase
VTVSGGILDPSDFDYDLPPELIAQEPAERRDESRLMVVDRPEGVLHHSRFNSLPDLLRPGDVLIANESRVIPARLHGVLPTGGAVEILLVKRTGTTTWEAMVRPGRKLRPGAEITFPGGVMATVEAVIEDGQRVVVFHGATDFDRWLEEAGQLPTPPYVKHYPEDPERYQTIYARSPGSVAAPTAGLHFTPDLLQRIHETGVEVHFVTLHVGPGTFKPLRDQRLASVRLHSEPGAISPGAADAVQRAKAERRRVIAVGTTTTRLLEGVTKKHGQIVAGSHDVDLFIYPPYQFKVVDALITNFHLPRSSLLMLASAFAGVELVRHAYEEAVAHRYRFYSFGDAMFIA